MIIVNGTATTAPKYFHNAGGSEPWGGKADAELSALELVDILQFARQEGRRQGWNAARAKLVRRNPDGEIVSNHNIFHPDFLGGEPYNCWEDHFYLGANDAADECAKLSEASQ